MSTLYNLTSDYVDLLKMVDNGDFELSDITDTLDGIHGEIDDKIQSTVCVIREMESEAKRFDDEIARMQNIKKTYSNTAVRLKDYIRTQMEVVGLDKSKGLFSVSLGKPSISTQINSIDSLPEKYKKISISADKTEIGRALKSGEKIEGAELVEGNKRLTIR